MAMKKTKKSRLEEAGWRVGTAADFLGLTQEETALIEMKLGLAATLRKRRQARKLTQTQLAKQLGSSQSRVAKMEAADPSVSIDLLVRAPHFRSSGPSRWRRPSGHPGQAGARGPATGAPAGPRRARRPRAGAAP
jgi:DNA-binding XRE family transcriptional regulator